MHALNAFVIETVLISFTCSYSSKIDYLI